MLAVFLYSHSCGAGGAGERNRIDEAGKTAGNRQQGIFLKNSFKMNQRAVSSYSSY
jgi:hypothetical protein